MASKTNTENAKEIESSSNPYSLLHDQSKNIDKINDQVLFLFFLSANESESEKKKKKFNPEIGEAVPLQTTIYMKGPVVKGFGRGSKLLGIPTGLIDENLKPQKNQKIKQTR